MYSEEENYGMCPNVISLSPIRYSVCPLIILNTELQIPSTCITVRYVFRGGAVLKITMSTGFEYSRQASWWFCGSDATFKSEKIRISEKSVV
jgi:hypothetical protein